MKNNVKNSDGLATEMSTKYQALKSQSKSKIMPSRWESTGCRPQTCTYKRTPKAIEGFAYYNGAPRLVSTIDKDQTPSHNEKTGTKSQTNIFSN